MALTKRQYKIFDYIQENQSAKRLDIEKYIQSLDENISKITVIRDLDILLKEKLIKKSGQARSITYSPISNNELLRKYNVEEYFSIETDKRKVKYQSFNFNIFTEFKDIFSQIELKELEKINKIFIEKIKKLTPIALKKSLNG